MTAEAISVAQWTTFLRPRYVWIKNKKKTPKKKNKKKKKKQKDQTAAFKVFRREQGEAFKDRIFFSCDQIELAWTLCIENCFPVVLRAAYSVLFVI